MDSANASVAALKRDLADAQSQAAEASQAAADAEGQLADRDQDEAQRLRSLRCFLRPSNCANSNALHESGQR